MDINTITNQQALIDFLYLVNLRPSGGKSGMIVGLWVPSSQHRQLVRSLDDQVRYSMDSFLVNARVDPFLAESADYTCFVLCGQTIVIQPSPNDGEARYLIASRYAAFPAPVSLRYNQAEPALMDAVL